MTKEQKPTRGEQLRAAAKRVREELAVYQRVLADRRTPWLARGVLGLALAYLLSPVDLIPDFIPVLGALDDLVIVPGLVYLALRMIPPEVVAEARAQVRSDPPPESEPDSPPPAKP
ncbi:MAG TPA: DUF1232 domain-containing protein [Armatimonadota bacterium]|jgi:uncharacterized membrane protein YkvA (DUF1232 family)